MRKFTIRILLFSLLLSLSGCYTAKPQFLRGDYYMTGDSNCRSSTQRTSTTINCYDSDGELLGFRTAMTDQELDMYRHNQQMKQQQSNQIYNTNNQNKPVFCNTIGTMTYCN